MPGIEKCHSPGCETLIAIPPPHWYVQKGTPGVLLCSACQKGLRPGPSPHRRRDRDEEEREEREDRVDPSKNLRLTFAEKKLKGRVG
jgi:hypothetical protein